MRNWFGTGPKLNSSIGVDFLLQLVSGLFDVVYLSANLILFNLGLLLVGSINSFRFNLQFNSCSIQC